MPSEWTCEPTYYSDGIYCDCGCGVADPDCVTGLPCFEYAVKRLLTVPLLDSPDAPVLVFNFSLSDSVLTSEGPRGAAAPKELVEYRLDAFLPRAHVDPQVHGIIFRNLSAGKAEIWSNLDGSSPTLHLTATRARPPALDPPCLAHSYL